MLVIVLLIAAFNLASSVPVLPSTTDFGAAASVTIFGRELPECVNVARHRTTQDIVLSCLSTIFACTWVAVHPNVSRPNVSKRKKFLERVFVMAYGILAPEFVIGWAIRQWRGAMRNAAEYNKKHYGATPPPSNLQWYIWYRFFQGETPHLWTTTHGFLLEMHGLVDDSGKPVVSVQQICDPLDISEEEISDKSKGDFLTKLLVVLQTTWFIFECLARWLHHLPVTELEVITLAFALLNIGTYALWWNKPQRMGLAIRMDRYRSPKRDPREKEAAGGDAGNTMPRTPLRTWSEQSADEVDPLLGNPSNQRSGFVGRAAEVVSRLMCRFNGLMSTATMAFSRRRLRSLTFNDIIAIAKGPCRPLIAMICNQEDSECGYIFYSSREDVVANISTAILGTLFGGLHLIPLWSPLFPSSAEKLLWKLSAISITIQPFLYIFSAFSAYAVSYPFLEAVESFLTLVSCAFYFTARTIIITLAFTTLRELPPEAFRNIAWTTFIPHL